MRTTHTRTFALLEVPKAAYRFIQKGLLDAGYNTAVTDVGTLSKPQEALDMHGVALVEAQMAQRAPDMVQAVMAKVRQYRQVTGSTDAHELHEEIEMAVVDASVPTVEQLKDALWQACYHGGLDTLSEAVVDGTIQGNDHPALQQAAEALHRRWP